MAVDLILGTAGHIDHGKTALVKALTGVDTDRLPEEKRRGITIELGFAELVLDQYRLGIVDVPGHERFVRTMLAGATGIDVALLVVAADDSVKPQTREHLEILRLLDLEAGVIALTKCDLPDPAWVDLVEQEVRELVSGTFLEAAPLVRTSALTGQGVDALATALAEAAARAANSDRRREAGPFRMAVDRAFTLPGHGTIVTGSVSSGRVRVGDELAVEPGGPRARVRSLQNHDRPAEEVHRGQRAAINLPGLEHQQINRGHELATPGHLVPSRLLSVTLKLLDSAPRPLKHRARVRLHLGTAELMASVVLLDRDRLLPGDSGPAQLFLKQPAVATWGQPLVIRSESPVITIGGGRVLDPDAPKLRRRDDRGLGRLADLSSGDPLVRASAAIGFVGHRKWEPEHLARIAGVSDADQICRKLVDRGDLVEIVVSPTRTVRIHREVLDDLAARIETVLAEMHRQSPLQAAIDRSRLASRFAYLDSDAVLDAVLASMAAAGRVQVTERAVALAGHGPKLSRGQCDLLRQIVEVYAEAEFQPPTLKELKSRFAPNQAAIRELVELAAADGRLVKISAEFYLHADAERESRKTLADRLAEGPGMTVSQIREALATTRRYAIPLCEYFDRIGFTERQGDLRVLKSRSSSAQETE